MNVQPTPSHARQPMPPAHGATDPTESRRRVPAAGPRLLFTWPVEFEVEPWRP